MIEVRCFESLEDAASLRKEINTLNMVSARPDPFSTFEFFENFYHYDEFCRRNQEIRLWFIVAFLDGRLIGYMVLKRLVRKVLGLRTWKLDFFVTHDTDRPHLVARPEHLNQVSVAIYGFLIGRKQEWSLLEFQQQDHTSSIFPPPGTVALKNYMVREWPSLENGTIHVRWGSLREYFLALSGKFRSNLSRQIRSLLAHGNVEFLASSDLASIQALFGLYLSIEPRSWKSEANVSIGRSAERIEYFKGLLDARQPMRLTVCILLLDGMPIAGLITGAFWKGLYALHIVYDDGLSRLAPGSAMLLMGMRQAIDGKYAFFNLLSGFGYYKTRWLAEITETRIAQIYRIGGLPFWHRVLGDWKRLMFPVKHQKTRARFNTLRREVSERKGKETEAGKVPVVISQEERERIDALVAEIRRGQGEFLSTAELASVMPFEIKRMPEVSTEC